MEADFPGHFPYTGRGVGFARGEPMLFIEGLGRVKDSRSSLLTYACVAHDVVNDDEPLLIQIFKDGVPYDGMEPLPCTASFW